MYSSLPPISEVGAYDRGIYSLLYATSLIVFYNVYDVPPYFWYFFHVSDHSIVLGIRFSGFHRRFKGSMTPLSTALPSSCI